VSNIMDGNVGFRDLVHLNPPRPAPKVVKEASEYPKCMVHPQHQEAVPDEHHEKEVGHERLFGTSIQRWIVPGSPEK
jgi:hypothetical protein